MKLYFLIILLFSISVFGQNTPFSSQKAKPCELSIKEAPSLRDLRLGYSEWDAEAIFPQFKSMIKPVMTEVHIKKEGDKYIELSSDHKDYEQNKQEVYVGDKTVEYISKDGIKIKGLEDISSIAVSFYNGSLYRIIVSYESKDFSWKDSGEFAYVITEKLNVPKEYWNVKEYSAHINCMGFAVVAMARGSKATLSMYSYSTTNDIQSKAKKSVIEKLSQKNIDDLEKKKAFKP